MNRAAEAMALGLFLLSACEQRSANQAPVDRPAPPFVPQALTQVETWDHLEVTWNRQRTALVHESSGWKLAEPVVARADERVVHSLLRALGSPLSRVEAQPTVSQLHAWGLDNPQARVEARRAGATLALIAGNENAFDGSFWVQRIGSSEVFAMPGGSLQALTQTTYALRDKTVVPGRPEAIVRIDVKRARDAYRLEREGPRGWKVDGVPAITGEVARALDADVALRFVAFEGGTGMTSRGPSSDLEVRWHAKDHSEVTLTVLATKADAISCRVQRGSETVTGRLPSDALDAWRRGPNAFVKKETTAKNGARSSD